MMDQHVIYWKAWLARPSVAAFYDWRKRRMGA